MGEHLLRRRVQQGCLQRQVAEHLGVTDTTILNWEKGWTTPEARHWPKIIDYLGYDPQPQATTLGQRLRAQRMTLGLSRKQAARRLAIDEKTFKAFEDDVRTPNQGAARKLANFLGEDLK